MKLTIPRSTSVVRIPVSIVLPLTSSVVIFDGNFCGVVDKVFVPLWGSNQPQAKRHILEYRHLSKLVCVLIRARFKPLSDQREC